MFFLFNLLFFFFFCKNSDGSFQLIPMFVSQWYNNVHTTWYLGIFQFVEKKMNKVLQYMPIILYCFILAS